MKNELTPVQMMDYLQSVKTLEMLKLMQQNAKAELQKRIQECRSIVRTKNKPFIEARRDIYSAETMKERGTYGWIILAAIFGGLCGIAMSASSSKYVSFFSALLLDFGGLVWGALKGAGIVVGIVLIIDAITARVHRYQGEKEIERKYQADVLEAERTNETITKYNRVLQMRRDEALRMIGLYKKQIERIEQYASEIGMLLEECYECGVIYPKYRYNLGYICRFIEYFESGMCNSLTGPNGGYILLDQDIKFHVVDEKLDSIRDKLDLMREEQCELYYAIQQCNRSIGDLGDSMDNLADQVRKHDDKLEDKLDSINYNINVENEYSRITANYAMYRYIWQR